MIAELLQHNSVYRCKCEFNTEENDELQLNVGDIVIGSSEPTSDWFYGYKSGQFGWFPQEYTEQLSVSGSIKIKTNTSILTYSLDNYQTFTESFLPDEINFIREYKAKYGSILKDFSSKNLSRLFDMESIFRLCESFILKYDAHIEALEMEQKKNGEKTKIFKLYMDFYNNLFKTILYYCQLHAFTVKNIATHRDKIDDFCKNKQISNSYIDMAKFLSSPFFRIESISRSITEVFEYLDNTSGLFFQYKAVQCEFDFLYTGSQEIRKCYNFLAQVAPRLEDKIKGEEEIKLENLSESLLYSFNVHPIDISINDDSTTYYIILHTQYLFFGNLVSQTELESFSLINRFSLPQTDIQDIDNDEEWSNQIQISCKDNDYERTFMMENSKVKTVFFSIFEYLKQGGKYSPFWVEKKTITTTIPNIPIKHVVIRWNRNKYTENSETYKIEYKKLINIICGSVAIPPNVTTEEKVFTIKQLTERVEHLEDLVNDISRKLNHQISREAHLEEVIFKWIKTSKS